MSETATDDGRRPRDPAAVSRFVERFATVMVESGLPRIASRVFAALLATDSGRLTAAELSERLHASPAAISGAVRYLVQVQLIRREREPGSRRDHYVVDDDFWYEAITRRDHVLLRWESGLREGVEALGETTPAGARIAETREFFRFLQNEMPEMLKRWHAHRDRLRRGLDPTG